MATDAQFQDLVNRVAALEDAVAQIRAVDRGQDTTIRQSTLKIEQVLNDVKRDVESLRQTVTTKLG